MLTREEVADIGPALQPDCILDAPQGFSNPLVTEKELQAAMANPLCSCACTHADIEALVPGWSHAVHAARVVEPGLYRGHDDRRKPALLSDVGLLETSASEGSRAARPQRALTIAPSVTEPCPFRSKHNFRTPPSLVQSASVGGSCTAASRPTRWSDDVDEVIYRGLQTLLIATVLAAPGPVTLEQEGAHA